MRILTRDDQGGALTVSRYLGGGPQVALARNECSVVSIQHAIVSTLPAVVSFPLSVVGIRPSVVCILASVVSRYSQPNGTSISHLPGKTLEQLWQRAKFYCH